MYRVAMVCEGPADREVLQAVLDCYFDDYEPVVVQPPTGLLGGDAGPFGGGWKGVRSWCRNEVACQGGVERVGVLDNADILVIHVDADLAEDEEIALSVPCPPPERIADKVRGLVLEWLGQSSLPDRVVLCIPCMATEAWALVALFPGNPAVIPCDPMPADGVCVECRDDIKKVLRRAGRKLKPKLVVSESGRLKNQSAGYRAVGERISGGWQQVMKRCSSARRFDEDFNAARRPAG